MEEKTKTVLLFAGMIAGFIAVIIFASVFLFIGNAVPDQPSSNLNQSQIPANDSALWNTVGNSELGFQFKYPNNFFDAGHDPKISVAQCSSDQACQNGQKLTVNGVQYCHVQTQDAAAGSQFYLDTYTTAKNGQCLMVELNTKTTTCENYLPIEQGNTRQQTNYDACIKHRTERPAILNQIVNTFTFGQ